MEQPIDYDAGVDAAGLLFMLGYSVAQQDQRPAWNKDDFFGTRFSSPIASLVKYNQSDYAMPARSSKSNAATSTAPPNQTCNPHTDHKGSKQKSWNSGRLRSRCRSLRVSVPASAGEGECLLDRH
jgi:hypothetical protein